MTIAKKIRELKNIHMHDDIWIIAAGSSMNYINPSFFDNKKTIGINRVSIKFNCDYVVVKDGRGFDLTKKSIHKKTKVIISKHESGNPHQKLNSFPGEHWVFNHPAKPGEMPNLNCIHRDTEEIVVSYSTITSGIHIAAFMGAKNIILCGHDCGSINNKICMDNYYSNIQPVQGTANEYYKWLSKIESHTIKVVKKIREEYNCNVHSLNPFINLNLEGNKYNNHKRRLNEIK